VAVRTFFRYFSSKQHILFGDVGHDRVTRLRDELAARPRTEPILTSVRLVLDAMDDVDAEEQEQIMLRFRLLERQPSLVPMYLRLSNELRETVAAFVASRSGLDVRRHPYPMMVASAMAACWDIAMHVWAGTDGSRSLRSLRREVFDTLTVGLSEPPRP
jgi:AcrR family transcriptional regulator